MRSHLPRTLAAAMCLAVVSCEGTSLLGPIEPSDVSMTVSAAGGLTGSAYSLRVDGETGDVSGIECQGVLCDFQPDELILRISKGQVAALAVRLEQAGVLQHDGRDFGDECCDIGSFEFDYRRGDLSGSFEGTTTRIPEGLVRAITPVAGLANRVVPMLIDSANPPAEWPDDTYALGDVSVEGTIVDLEVSFGGGCEAHTFDLVGLGASLDSSPAEIDAIVSHDAFGDACEAYLTETRRFETTPLRTLFETVYGPITETTPIVIRLAVPGQEEPVLIEVVVG
ncbi:MAG: hypothetical protein AAF389_02205 [Gemmatimonadota bacterium]